MASEKRQRLAGDVGSWALNVVTSVGLIFVNKVVMSSYGFRFATTLTACHFGVTSLAGFASAALGYTTLKPIPFWDLFWFSLVANVSIVGMNLSLLLNSVGFYQIAKLSMIPVVCVLERVLNAKTYSRPVILSVIMVVFGVAIVTVTDVTVNFKGFMAAVMAVLATALQQIFIGSLQKKHNVSSFELLSKTAPIQAASLLPLGPFMDFALTGNYLLNYTLSTAAFLFISLSCLLAVGCNVSQYLVIGRFSAVTFQVLGHIKTVCVLAMGWLFFHDIITSKNILGMVITVIGMVFYGRAAEAEKKAAAAAPAYIKSNTSSDPFTVGDEEDVSLLKASDFQEHIGAPPVKDIELGFETSKR
ncbi:hypothetical protein SELMODRAFT_92835 [Selaginella moellendorffii]|uniref:Sugar phosphate transporter domain-containing protein n=1 Tax=Selaginella moellendorffii TaxID=88036 RepID=D8RFA2_SELML|nr:UDP-rhamnose/UDP-galactose transporter 3 [Selaginella moellendorffii]XP_002981428.1 UDP-rhamnose/UDP-galactose transporter 3 [Selaginella moellendorffii]EFJ17616.1 hypothetical protein SELMODRAFT_178861 [Selaginella moellendorffii]EFJ29082.1 hypothetical protein SELMODRAFT_92835 [Selaginella moellendorffii]|eukprot:XP_002969958.1 UDP-rhamnose/UDP-galactose transporter 3 [Selaginella moellendorffii]